MKDKLKKYLLPNLPYLFFVYLFDKLCQAVRLAPGLDVSEKLLHIGQGFQTAFASSAPSFHVLDTHYVRVDFLEEVVLGEIRRLTKFASLYEDEFVKAVIGHSQQAEQTDRKLKEKELQTLLARDEELDGLFERIYEDNVSGKLSDDRFAKMSRRYEDEQKELAEKIKKLRSEIEKQSSRSMTTDMFIGLVRKYTRARKLTPRMLNELIEKIEVFNAEKIDGVWEQRLRIHYNCVGTIEIPTVLPLPIPEVSVNTRKGVVVNYAPCELAV